MVHLTRLPHIPATTGTPSHPTQVSSDQALCSLSLRTLPPPSICFPNTHPPTHTRTHTHTNAHPHISSSSVSKGHIPYPKIMHLLRALTYLILTSPFSHSLLTKWISFSLSPRETSRLLCLPPSSLLWSLPVLSSSESWGLVQWL